jgi:pimeloyl-ACP methyl ester carboxylesterase
MSLFRILPIVLCAVLAACAGPQRQAASASAQRGTLASVRGCDVHYAVRGPAIATDPVAIIAHGFMRDGSYMAGWAEAFAAAGVTAVTVDLCASSAVDGRHADNGADMVALRRALGVREAVYVGVSAGGLAALIAASSDREGTRALLLLDPVNAGGQARSAAGKVRAPVAALVAKPQACNAWGNIDPALRSLGNAATVRIANASHCDFEWPGDRLCRIACVATGSGAKRDEAQARIRRLGVEFVAAAARGDDAALARWRNAAGHFSLEPVTSLPDHRR